ncbi:hypothetical protein ACFSTC_48920 [Nonomuraea ferruginea]
MSFLEYYAGVLALVSLTATVALGLLTTERVFPVPGEPGPRAARAPGRRVRRDGVPAHARRAHDLAGARLARPPP